METEDIKLGIQKFGTKNFPIQKGRLEKKTMNWNEISK